MVKETLSHPHPMAHLKLAMGVGGSLLGLTEGGACACHCLVFHYYLHSPSAFTTLVSLCGHTETEREITPRPKSSERVFLYSFSPPYTGDVLLTLTRRGSCKAGSSGYGWLSAHSLILSKVGTL